MKRLSDSEKFLSDKRLRVLVRDWRRRASVRRKAIKRDVTAYNSNIVDMLACVNTAYVSEKVRVFDLKVPNKFSIIESPSEAVKSITSLSAAGRHRRKKLIRIDQFHMEEVDLAAEAIQGLVAKEIEREAKSRYRKFNIGGYLPHNEKLEKYVRAIGIIKALGVKHELLSRDQESRLRIFRKRSKPSSERDTLGVADYKEKTAADFVRHINDCLEDNGRQLTFTSKMRLAEYTGEIIANAEDHSGMFEWSIFGYLDNESEHHICEIAIFNFGDTIAQTFSALPKATYAYDSVYPYIEKHTKSGWFTVGWDKDDLLTLIALQSHISSKNRSAADTRGQGTVEMIEFFQKVHKECSGDGNGCAKMAILSGRTHILFDGRYVMRPDESGRNIISFNDDNDLNKRPDPRYVRNLGDVFFPGTVISIRFSLQASQTEEVD